MKMNQLFLIGAHENQVVFFIFWEYIFIVNQLLWNIYFATQKKNINIHTVDTD